MTTRTIILARCIAVFEKSFHSCKETLETLAPWPMDQPRAGVQRKGKMQIYKPLGGCRGCSRGSQGWMPEHWRQIESLAGVRISLWLCPKEHFIWSWPWRLGVHVRVQLRAKAGRKARGTNGFSEGQDPTEAVSASSCASAIADLFKDLRPNTETFKECSYTPFKHYYKSPVATKPTAKI